MSRSTAGRKGGVELARQALAINSFLVRTGGAELDRTRVARLLGLPSCETNNDYKAVDNVMGLVLSGFDYGNGPTFLKVEEKLPDNNARGDLQTQTILKESEIDSPIGKPIRLSWMEAAAVEEAIVQTGGFNPGWMSTIKDAWWPLTIDQETLERISGTDSSVDPDTIILCSAAIGKQRKLRFAYRDEKGHETNRLVVPSRLKRENVWILSAIDLNKREHRNFRLDRMSKVKPLKDGAEPEDYVTVSSDRTETVRLMFKNDMWLDVFLWPNLSMDDTPQDGYVASGQIPYFPGSKFLPAQIAATSGEVICDSDDVMKAAAAWRDALRAELP